MPASPIPPTRDQLKHRAAALRTAALVCGSLALFIVVFATHADWTPAARWMALRILLLGGGMLAFWGLVAVRAHQVSRGYSQNGNFIPRWLWIVGGAWTLGVILWPHL